MRIVFKILLFPIALLCQVLAVCVSALGSILTIGLRLLAGLAGIGFFAALIGRYYEKQHGCKLVSVRCNHSNGVNGGFYVR